MNHDVMSPVPTDGLRRVGGFRALGFTRLGEACSKPFFSMFGRTKP